MRQSREFNHELRIIGASQSCFIMYDVGLEIKTFFYIYISNYKTKELLSVPIFCKKFFLYLQWF